MKALAKNKGILLAILLFILAISVYNYFKDSLVSVIAPPQNVGADLVELFAGLQKVTLNQELLSSPLYNSLVDFGIELAPQPTGRPNPFNTIGID